MRTEYAGTLSGGQRKLLELARALMTDPQLVLLDEPMAGVHPSLGADLLRLVRQFRDDRGTTFLLIEHDMNVVMDVSDHVTVMAEGQVISAGTATSVRSDEKVIEAYLGRSSTVVRESSRGARTTEQPSSPPTSSVLRLHKVLAGYHGSRTLHGVSLNVDDGEVVCLIGPNGAGKSTVLKSLMGFAEWQGGDAHFGPRDRQVSVARLPAHQLVRLGVGYVPQVSNVFPDLSVLENIEIGTLGNRALARSVGEVLEQFPVLQPRVRQRAGTLSGGERQLLALARALICRPTLLLLDEPTAALSPLAATKIFETIAQVADSGTSVLLVEQNARQALAISDRAYVLVAGETAYSGPAAQLLGSDELSALYLGGGQSSPDGQDAHG